MRANPKRGAAVAVVVTALAYACLSPTEITVRVTADPSLCGALQATVAAGEPGQLVTVAETSARTTGCPRDAKTGEIGSIVVIPSGDRGAKIEVRVVAGVGRSPDGCSPQDFAGCIEAHRILRYVRHQPLDLPIALSASCIGVKCVPGTACFDGGCYTYDPDVPGYCDPTAGPCAPVDAGADVATGDATPGPCPAGRGAAMVRVSLPAVTFCIDATEVTNSHFHAFVADPTRPKPSGVCAFKSGYPSAPINDLPIAGADWCDAQGFCAWAGKRLCKNLRGSRPSEGDASYPGSEWYLACSAGGRHLYPYGDVYDPEACKTDGARSPITTVRDVGSLATCTGGFPGIYDMSATLHDWVDGCSAETGSDDLCRTEGGSYSHAAHTDFACAFAESFAQYQLRKDAGPDFGIRCCAD